MSPLAEILDRLRRRRQPPGRAAATVGVPAAEPDVGKELTSLFGDLDQIDAEADAVVATGRLEAAAIEREGRYEAQRVLDQAAREAELVRDQLCRQQRKAAERQAQAILADARAEAQRLRDRAAQQSPAVVAEVVALLLQGAG